MHPQLSFGWARRRKGGAVVFFEAICLTLSSSHPGNCNWHFDFKVDLY